VLGRLVALIALAALLGASALARSASADGDGDGYPDALELSGSDRAAFADWFASVAEAQFYGPSPDWLKADRDCAGLLRYAYRAALEPHDAAFFRRFAFLPRPRHGEVRAYGYPAPLVSRSLFRVAAGPYRAGDVEAGLLVGRTDARHLANHASLPVSKTASGARRGDLLFFLRPGLGAYHSMVYLGDGRVVYHTGEVAGGGEVRLLTLATLMRHPRPRLPPHRVEPELSGLLPLESPRVNSPSPRASDPPEAA
jgi:uncharacterized protein YfaT (DUF1175 family)